MTPLYREGDFKHCIRRGWLRLYGTEWVPAATWWKIKLAGL